MVDQFGIMMDTQATDVVTFDFKGTSIRLAWLQALSFSKGLTLLSDTITSPTSHKHLLGQLVKL